MTRTQAKWLLEDTAQRLGERFASVQIHASWMHEKEDGQRNGQTSSAHGGCGDWYARKALCEEFIESDQQTSLAREVARALETDE